MQSAASYALASLLVIAIASTFALYAEPSGVGHHGGSILGLIIISSLLSVLPALFAFVLFRAGAIASKRSSDSGSAFAIGIAFAAGASILAIGVGLSMHSLKLAACVLVVLNCVFAYFAPFAFGRRTAGADSAFVYEPIVSEDIAKKCGVASFSIFLAILAGIVLVILAAISAGGNGGGHPGGIILIIFIAFGIFGLAPIGAALGFLGRPHRNGKALIGLLGNLLLLFPALWFYTHI